MSGLTECSHSTGLGDINCNIHSFYLVVSQKSKFGRVMAERVFFYQKEVVDVALGDSKGQGVDIHDYGYYCLFYCFCTMWMFRKSFNLNTFLAILTAMGYVMAEVMSPTVTMPAPLK